MAARKGGSSGGRGDIDSLPDRSREATAGVRSLGKAFDELSTKGRINSSVFLGLAGSLGQVHPALGLVAAGIGVVVAHGERFKQLDLQDAINEFSASARVAGLEWDILSAKMQAGAGVSGRLREKLEELAKTEVLIQNRHRLLADETKRLEESVEKGRTKQEFATASLNAYTKQTEKAIQLLTDRRTKIEGEIDAIKASQAATERWSNAIVRNNLPLFEQVRLLKERRDYMMEVAALQGKEGDIGFSAEFVKRINDAANKTTDLAYGLEQVGFMAASAVGGIATDAFNQYADAWDRVIDGQNAFNKSSGRAMQNALAGTLRAVGQEAAARAIMETAMGIAASSGPLGLATYGDPSKHFAAAAMFASVAALAGVGSAALSVKPAGGGGGGRGGGGGSGGSAAGGRNVTVNVTTFGTFDFEQKRVLAQAVQEAIAEGG